MSYDPHHHRHQHHYVREFVPHYHPRSDYLPTQVHDGEHDSHANSLIRQYEEEKRRGHVYTNRPVEFNPNRYRSLRVYECVQVDRPISEEQFSRMVRR